MPDARSLNILVVDDQQTMRGIARQCLKLALAERDSEKERILLSRLQSRSKPKPARDTRPVEAAATAPIASRPEEPPVELVKARKLMEMGNYFGAVRYLEKLEHRGTNQEATLTLLQQARSALAHNTDTLLSAGDTLYREGNIEAALAVWEATMAVNPYNLAARKKSEQALKDLSPE